MVPRRNSTTPSSGQTSQCPTSGTFSGRRPLSLFTRQKLPRPSMAQTVETESPQSDSFPQGTSTTPPIPPRPSSHFPQLPPGNNGLRRQSTRRNTYESFSSAPEIPLQSQPPNIIPMPAPLLPQNSTHPPPTPIVFHPPAPGEGVGGFAATFSPRRGSSREYLHQYTADYPRRFDMPSPRSDWAGSPHYESADISGGIHADVWPTYNKISQEFDEKNLAKWNTDLDVLLLFVSHLSRSDRRLRLN